MLRILEKLGLRRTLLLAFGLAGAVSAVGAVIAIGAVVRASLMEGLVRHGESVVHAIAADVPPLLESGSLARMKDEIEHDVLGSPVAWVVVLRADGSVASSTLKTPDAPGPEAVVELHRDGRFAAVQARAGVLALSLPLEAVGRPGEPARSVGRVLLGLSTRDVDASVARAQEGSDS
jgi:hypothetical protein